MGYSIEEFDKAKTQVLKYVLYQKRCEQEIRSKFINKIEENMLEDIIELRKLKFLNKKKFQNLKVNL